MKHISLFLLASSVALVAFGDGDALYWKRGTGNESWGKASNWQTAGGEAPAVAPTNGEDVVLPPYEFSSSDKNAHAKIVTGGFTGSGDSVSLTGDSVNPTVGVLSGSHQYFIEHGSHREYTIPSIRRFTVSDPDGFAGYFTSGDVRSYLTLAATAEHSPVFPSIGAKSRLYVEVPTAGTSASVDTVYEYGVVAKTGAGDLEIGSTRGELTDMLVNAGGITIDGFEGGVEAKLASLLAGARVHLDASDESSLEKYVDPADGRTCVSKWNDVRGNGFHAVTNGYRSSGNTLPYIRAPFISPSTSPTGLPFVDFGTQNYWAEHGLGEIYGPTNCGMYFSTGITGIREVFYVVETPGSAYMTCALGSSSLTGSYFFLNQYTDAYFTRIEATTNVWAGEFAYNGKPMRIQDRTSYVTNCYVISVGTLGPTEVSALGIDRNYTSTSGGVRLGEVLLFTNVMTRAERMLVNGYLVNKWRTGGTLRDAGTVLLTSGATGIAVPDGHDVHVRAVATQTGGIVKKGGGTLRVDALHPADAPVTVEGGTVILEGEQVSTDAPADGAYIWLDATKDGTLEKQQVGTTNFVSVWRDCREGVDVVATATMSGDANAAAATPPTMPTVTTLGSLQAISFGGSSSPDTLAMMKFPSWNTSGKAYAGFIVVRNKSSNSGKNIFGCSNLDLLRSGTQLHSPSYSFPATHAAKWTVNGEPVDPSNLTSSQSTLVNHSSYTSVIAFSGQYPVRCDGLCVDRTTRSGYMTIGEVIVYHRPLTDSERVQTEAYLMKKWLGTDHPAAAKAMGTISFATDTEIALGGSSDVEVAEISGGDGNLVKAGSGDVSVGLLPSSSPVTNVVVEAGTLSIPSSGNLAVKRLEKEMLYHLDATRTDTVVFADGVNVSRWNDCRAGSSVYMRSCWPDNLPDNDFAKIVKGYPTLVDVETRTGITRKMLDFGYTFKSDGSFKPAETNAAMIRFPSKRTGVKETFSIFSDAHGRRDTPFFSTVDWSLVHIRGYNNNGRLFASDGYAGNWLSGTVSIDCVPIANSSAAYPAGVHLLSMCTAEGTTFDFTAFGNERKYTAGGCLIGEQIGFARELSQDERKLMQDRLMAKWFGEARPSATNELNSIEVASGATLNLVADEYMDEVVRCDRLAGGGDLAVGHIVAGLVETAPLGTENFSPLSVSGVLEFAEGAELKVRLGDRSGLVADDVYTLISASGLSGDFTVDRSELGRTRARVFVDGNAVKIRIMPHGISINFR